MYEVWLNVFWRRKMKKSNNERVCFTSLLRWLNHSRNFSYWATWQQSRVSKCACVLRMPVPVCCSIIFCQVTPGTWAYALSAFDAPCYKESFKNKFPMNFLNVPLLKKELTSFFEAKVCLPIMFTIQSSRMAGQNSAVYGENYHMLLFLMLYPLSESF